MPRQEEAGLFPYLKMIDWVNGFILPLIKVTFIIGVGGYIIYITIKAVHNAWTKQAKFTFKYGVLRRKYPEKTVKWCMDCVDKGIGYYDAKKLMMIKMLPKSKVYETLYIYDKILDELDMKGGLKNVRELKRTYSKGEGTEYPTC